MGKIVSTTDVFGGVNRLEVKKDGEFYNCVNVLCDEYPAVLCGVSQSTAVTTEKAIIKAFPHIDSGIDYTFFEGVYEDYKFTYGGYNSKNELNVFTASVMQDFKLFRIGSVFYDIENYKRIFSKMGGSYDITDGYAIIIGTIAPTDKDTIRITISGTKPVRSVGDVYAIKISDKYAQEHNFSEQMDTFSGIADYAAYYVAESVTSTSNGYAIICRGVANDGSLFTISDSYSFTLSDSCYIYKKYPSFSYLCSHLNRAAGLTLNGSEIMLSGLGEYNSFYDFSGESTDSYSVSIPDAGSFTGCISYDNTLIVFKKNIMYGLYGDLPDNFQLLTISEDIGCIDPESMCICGGSLYFLAQSGFYRYRGAKPICISRKLNKKYVKAKLCSDGNTLYCLCTDEHGLKELLCCDISFNIWYSLSFKPNDIFCQNGMLYMVYDYEITKLEKGAGGEWCLESGNMTDSFFNDRAVTEIYIRARFFYDDGYMNIYTAVDDKEFLPHVSVFGKGYHEFFIPVRFCEGKSFRYKIEGTGKCIITDIKRLYSAVET